MVLFHYDQEPIYDSDESTIFDATFANQFKWPRILANSEYSLIKNQICKQNQLLDWYFFYHGFAALDWYRDAEYIWTDTDIDHAYLSLNHIVTGRRSYRMALIARLCELDLIHKGLISFHGTNLDCQNELANEWSYLSSQDQQLVQTHLINSRSLPMILDSDLINGNASAAFGVHEYRLRQRAFVQIVNETVFYDDKLHLTEKIFQPVVTQRPFILAGAPGNLAYFQSYGFKTFSPWIDESYDDIIDPDQRLHCIVCEIERICSLPIRQLQSMLGDMQSVLIFNKTHLFGDFRKIIVNEMVDNFERCYKLYNNGRVNYALPPLPDFDKVRQMFSKH